MKRNMFKAMLFAMLAFVGVTFTSCEDEEPVAPALTVTPAELTFEEAGGTLTAEITANCEWIVDDASVSSWATITPKRGNGNATITVRVLEATQPNTGKVTFDLIHPDFGKWGKAEAELLLSQGFAGVDPNADAIYENNLDKTPAAENTTTHKWPYADDACMQNQTGTGAANVTYSSNGVTVRTTSASNGEHSDYKGSGTNNLLFGAAGNKFVVEKIDVTSSNKLQLTFGTDKYDYDNPAAMFDTKEMNITVSLDGAKWSDPLTYSFAGTVAGKWNVATCDFTLPQGTSELYIKFSTTVANVYRVDDIKLTAGVGGQEPVFKEATTVTINQITAAGPYKVNDGVVTCVHTQGFMMEDATGEILVFLGNAEGVKIPAVGTKVNVDGEVADFAGMLQFGKGTTVTENGTATPKTRTAELSDGKAIEALKDSKSPVYVKVKGKLSISDSGKGYKYYNLNIGAAKDASFAYADGALVDSFKDKTVEVEGWFLGVNKGGYHQIMVSSIKETTALPEPDAVKINAITAIGQYKVNGIVAGVSTQSFVMEDETGDILVYLGKGATIPAVGAKVAVNGSVEERNGQLQFARPEVTENGTATPKTRKAELKDGAAIEALKSETAPVFIMAKGALEVKPNKEGTFNYYNVTVAGLSKALSLTYPAASVDAFNGKNIEITGWYLGVNGGGYHQFLVSTIKEDGGVAPEPEPTKTTISEIKAAGKYLVENVAVAAVAKNGFLMYDGTATIWVFTQTEPTVKVGDKVTVSGDVEERFGAFQFSTPAVTSNGTSEIVLPTATVLDGAGIDNAYNNYTQPVYVQFSGVLAEQFLQVNVEGAKVAHPQLKNVPTAFNISSFYDKPVVVKGWITGIYEKYKTLNICLVEIAVDPNAAPTITVDPETLTFLSAGTQTIVASISGAKDGTTVEAVSSSAEFTVSVSGETVSVTTTEPTEAAVNGTVTINLMKGGEVVDSKVVNVTRNAKMAEGTGTITFIAKDAGFTNAQNLNNKVIGLDSYASVVFGKGKASTDPAFYDADNSVRLYQNGATMKVAVSGGKKISSIEMEFTKSMHYIGLAEGQTGTLTEQADAKHLKTWTGDATEVNFVTTGTDKKTRAYLVKMTINYK